jgi:hypothetical protein
LLGDEEFNKPERATGRSDYNMNNLPPGLYLPAFGRTVYSTMMLSTTKEYIKSDFSDQLNFYL